MTQLPVRFWSSWGCVQALVVTLAILLLPVPVGALDSGIDLLEALNLRTNLSQYDGVSVTKGFLPQQIAYHLESDDRKLILPTATYLRAANLIRGTPEFTFAAVLRQEQANSGTIVAFSNGYSRYLELQSSGRRDEIRFHYTSITSEGVILVHTESFPYRLADNTWHKIALSVSGPEIQLLIDCHPLYRRVTQSIPDRNFSASNMQLFIGQRNFRSHSSFKGDIQDVHLVSGMFGYLSQCPHMDTQCPTCGQFSLLQNSIQDLQKQLLQLTQRLVAAENRVSHLEECDCKKSCLINNTTKNDGEQWDVGCDICKCEHGIIKCGPRICDPTPCKYPVLEDGQCCPRCLKNCYINKQDFEHGERQVIGCRNCLCIDGNMKCEMSHCPQLTCPTEQQLSVPDGCCKFCPGDDYCSKGHACHTNATCLNLNTKYTCTCIPGFQGDGFHCKDIDECTQQGGPYGNHCHLNTRCVNMNGSYICECLSGYKRLDKFNCIEIDECKTGEHICNTNANCINTQGSYHCQCKDGYIGDGYECKPVCNQTCLNGGQCLAPGICTCRMGFIGKSCEQDLDECETDLHGCKSTSTCINMPGWYFCKCKSGYETHGTECIDIDECYHNTHSCHSSAKCLNTEGHFECHCPNNDDSDDVDDDVVSSTEECRLSCMFEDTEIPNGGMINPRNQPCKICKCNRGVITCEEPECNCTQWKNTHTNRRDLCCPQCDPKESCQHQELKHVQFRSGEQWIYQCQTCECLYGEFDCWKLECPPLTCDKPLPLAPGDCCQRCEEDPCFIVTNTTIINNQNLLGNNNNNEDDLKNKLKSFEYNKPCIYKGQTYLSGDHFNDPTNQCTTCACKDGQLCCSFDNTCSIIANDTTAQSSTESSVSSKATAEQQRRGGYKHRRQSEGERRQRREQQTFPPASTTLSMELQQPAVSKEIKSKYNTAINYNAYNQLYEINNDFNQTKDRNNHTDGDYNGNEEQQKTINKVTTTPSSTSETNKLFINNKKEINYLPTSISNFSINSQFNKNNNNANTTTRTKTTSATKIPSVSLSAGKTTPSLPGTTVKKLYKRRAGIYATATPSIKQQQQKPRKLLQRLPGE